MMSKFDQADQLSIESYAKKLVGSSLRKHVPVGIVTGSGRGRGSFGSILEEYYFGIIPNTRPEPDFKDAGVELKSSPLKQLKRGELVAKERLVMNVITYNEIHREVFRTSSFLKKNSLLLLMFYLYEKNIDLLDYIIKIARLWRFPKADLKIIEDDWNKIVQKIRDGKAHELSEGDTLYLGACTKSSDSTVRTKQPFSKELAKPRAFSLKQGYVNRMIKASLDAEPIVKDVKEYRTGETFEGLVLERFEPYIGLTSEQICVKLGIKINAGQKGYFAVLARMIMGVQKRKIEEFEKAGVEMKVIQIKRNGMPKEHMSFPAFKYKELIKEKWIDFDEEKDEQEPEFKQQLQKRFFFVVFECEKNCKKEECRILKKVMFWSMPVADLEGPVRSVWEETIKRIKNGEADKLPGIRENPVAHVRPHAKNAKDTEGTPENGFLIKKSFWLNQGYIKKQID